MAERRRATVLLVEDEASIRVVTTRMLELAGHTVVCCASAEEALDVVSTHAGPIDVLLSDIHLDRMRGPALAAEVLRRRPATGVILMSGYNEAEAVDEGMAPGTRFLAKPYGRGELMAAIDAVLAPEPGNSSSIGRQGP